MHRLDGPVFLILALTCPGPACLGAACLAETPGDDMEWAVGDYWLRLHPSSPWTFEPLNDILETMASGTSNNEARELARWTNLVLGDAEEGSAHLVVLRRRPPENPNVEPVQFLLIVRFDSSPEVGPTAALEVNLALARKISPNVKKYEPGETLVPGRSTTDAWGRLSRRSKAVGLTFEAPIENGEPLPLGFHAKAAASSTVAVTPLSRVANEESLHNHAIDALWQVSLSDISRAEEREKELSDKEDQQRDLKRNAGIFVAMAIAFGYFYYTHRRKKTKPST